MCVEYAEVKVESDCKLAEAETKRKFFKEEINTKRFKKESESISVSQINCLRQTYVMQYM